VSPRARRTESDSLLRSTEDGLILEVAEPSKETRPSEQCGVVRFDIDGCLRLILPIDAMELMPSGLCVYPASSQNKRDIVVCKDGEIIKIFRVHEG